MSEMIKKFRPPVISKEKADKGIRYIETPEQKDWLGQTLAINDIVIYIRGNPYDPISVAKVIGMYTRFDPRFKETVTTISLAIQQTWQKKVTRFGVPAEKLIKLHPTQYTEMVKDTLLKA